MDTAGKTSSVTAADGAPKKGAKTERPKVSAHARRKLEERRLIAIASMIRGGLPGGLPVNKKTIRQRLSMHHGIQVSEKRIFRDIEDLKALYHAPISFDPSRQSYCLTTEWEMATFDLGEQDVLPALMGMMLSRQLLPPMMEPKIHGVKDSLIAGARYRGSDYGALLHSIAFTAPPRVHLDNKMFQCIIHAWEQSQRIKIQLTAQAGTEDATILEPHAFFFWDGAWHLRAKVIDPETQKPRLERTWESIPLHRIATAEMLEQSFERDPNIKRKMAEEKLFDFRTIKNIRVLSSGHYPDVMLRVREREWFPGQESYMLPDGLLLSVPEAPEPVIVPWILQFGGRIRVMDPPELVALIKEEGRRIAGV